MHALRRYIETRSEELGWSQADLARASGLSRQHVSKVWNDDREMLSRLPTRATLEGLARGLRVPLEVVVLKAAEACGIPVSVTEVAVAKATSLTTEELLGEVRRRLELAEGGGRDGAPTKDAGDVPAPDPSDSRYIDPGVPADLDLAADEDREPARAFDDQRRPASD